MQRVFLLLVLLTLTACEIRLREIVTVEYPDLANLPYKRYNRVGNLCAASDGGFVAVTGRSSYNQISGPPFPVDRPLVQLHEITLIKTNGFGTPLWEKPIFTEEYPGLYTPVIRSMLDGGYVVALRDSKSTLIRVDAGGTVRWQKQGLTFSRTETIRIDSDNAILLVGSQDLLQRRIPVLSKVSSEGELIWANSYPNAFPGSQEALEVVVTNNGEYALTGIQRDPTAGYFGRLFFIKADRQGGIIWQKLFDFNGGRVITPVSDGGYLLTGRPDNRFHLIKIDGIGSIQQSRAANIFHNVLLLSVLPDGRTLLAGVETSSSNSSAYVYFLSTINRDGSLQTNAMIPGTETNLTGNVWGDQGGVLGSNESILFLANRAYGKEIILVRTGAEGTPIWTQVIAKGTY